MIMRRWLDAAGITEPELRRCYMAAMKCPAVHAAIKSRGLMCTVPPDRRPHILAVGAVAALADVRADSGDPATRRRRVEAWAEAVFAAVAAGHSEDPVLHAFAHTFGVWKLRAGYLERLFDAFRRDAEFTPFATYEELRRWAEASTGSSLMLFWPMLGSPGTMDAAEPMALRLGAMVQLADNLFDLADDLRNGRLYLPSEDLDRFSVEPDDLFRGRWSPAVADLLAFEVARARGTEKVTAELSPLALPACRPFLWGAPHVANIGLDEVLRGGAAVLRRVPSLPVNRTMAQLIEWGAGMGWKNLPFSSAIAD